MSAMMSGQPPFPPPGPLGGVVELFWGLRGATVSLAVRAESPLDAYAMERIGKVVGAVEELTTLLDMQSDQPDPPRRLDGRPVAEPAGPMYFPPDGQ